jgi:hypothetical protein
MISGAGATNSSAYRRLNNRILLENYYLPGDLKNQIEIFVDDYNHRRYHESINNLTSTGRQRSTARGQGAIGCGPARASVLARPGRQPSTARGHDTVL